MIKKFTSKYIWENKFKDGANVMFKKAERPNLLVSNLIKKWKILQPEQEQLEV